jgi:hypothetical protein
MTENEPTAKASGKGKATPSRKAAEAKNIRPLVAGKVTDPAAKKAAKAAIADERFKARQGMAEGDERYLSSRDKGPQRKLARQIVDSRFTVGELLLPVMGVVLILGVVFPTTGDPAVVELGLLVNLTMILVMWSLFGAIIIDAWLLGRKATKQAIAKFGSAEKGLALYAGLRSTQLRFMRLPKHGK